MYVRQPLEVVRPLSWPFDSAQDKPLVFFNLIFPYQDNYRYRASVRDAHVFCNQTPQISQKWRKGVKVLRFLRSKYKCPDKDFRS